MSTYESTIQRANRLSREQRRRVGAELRIARAAAGLSQRAVGRLVRASHTTIGRIERGDMARLTIDRVVLLAGVLGHDARVSLFPDGPLVRDRAQLALLERFRARIAASLRWRTELPMPIAGDRRAADGAIDGAEVQAFIEAVTRLDDVQAVIRRIDLKQRDLGGRRAILLVADTRHNRAVLRAVPELARRFPIPTRATLAALASGRDPGGDCLVVL